MKIIKVPKFDVCTCPYCGTVFLPEGGKEETFLNLQLEKMASRCPTCGTLCVAKILTEDSEDEYFTPDQVHNMSPEEVEKNFSAIMKSTKKWK